ncbi:MAG: hypothetical protein KDA53_05715 [Hyphomonas sp.]|nr:hypothetical protein [Hyphomonas sp.]
MSKRNTFLALTLASALLAAPALADGKVMKPVRGPEPLKAHPDCESGQGYFDERGVWICPVVTRIVTPPPVVTRVAVPATSYDFSGFNGGVGASIGSGYYGGGGGFIVEDRRRYSGVLQSSASVFTFNRTHRKVVRKPRGGGCGCN